MRVVISVAHGHEIRVFGHADSAPTVRSMEVDSKLDLRNKEIWPPNRDMLTKRIQILNFWNCVFSFQIAALKEHLKKVQEEEERMRLEEEEKQKRLEEARLKREEQVGAIVHLL